MKTVQLDYGAITIDTCIFENHGLSLEKGLLAQLEQFSSGLVKFILSDVIYNELNKHLIDKNKKSRAIVNQAIKAASNCVLIENKELEIIKNIFSTCESDELHAENRLQHFQKKTSLLIINSAQYLDVSRLLTMYFSSTSPFEQSGAKKSEFPDAFAILALEKWAEQNDTKVLAVSKDKGWIDFSSKSKFIKVVGDLAYALAYFQPHNFAASIILSLQDILKNEDDDHFVIPIKEAITDSLENTFDITIEASSRFSFEEDDVHATYQTHQLRVDDSDRIKINIVRVSSDVLVLQLQAEVYCDVKCYFSMSIHDSVDKDFVPMGGLHARTKESYVTSILLYLKGEFSTGLDNIELSNIEVLKTIQNADFGEIEPDWGNDEDEPDWFEPEELEEKIE